MDSWIVCYDISDPKRLRKVATICEDFGLRSQYSVFLMRISGTDFVRLRNRLYEAIDLDADQVMFVPVCDRCLNGSLTLGRPAAAPTARDAVIVT